MSTPTPSEARKSLLAGVKYVVFGMSVCAALVLIKLALEPRPIGLWAEKHTYGLLSSVLPRFAEDGPDVVVIDIAHLGGGKDPSTGDLTPTSRQELVQLLSAVARQRPLVIGVDIDFSPGDAGWVDPSDPAFFDECLRLNERIPVRLGVYRAMREGADGWLGLPKYSGLAAGLWLPKSDTHRLPLWTGGGAPGERLQTLGASLASAVASRQTPPALRVITETTVETTLRFEPGSPPVIAGFTVVNFSRLDQMRREFIPAATAADVAKRGDDLRGKLVLIGDVRRHSADDIFPVPNLEVGSPGVFLHASLANTLLREPVYEFTHTVRLILDFALTLIVLLVVVLLGRRAGKDGRADIHKLEDRVVACTILAVCVVGFALIAYFRVLWLDFLVVCAFLYLHPKIERAIAASKGAHMHDQVPG